VHVGQPHANLLIAILVRGPLIGFGQRRHTSDVQVEHALATTTQGQFTEELGSYRSHDRASIASITLPPARSILRIPRARSRRSAASFNQSAQLTAPSRRG